MFLSLIHVSCKILVEIQQLTFNLDTSSPNTFDRKELLRQFDELQSIKCDKTDIVAQAMELSSIPTDMNNVVNRTMIECYLSIRVLFGLI